MKSQTAATTLVDLDQGQFIELANMIGNCGQEANAMAITAAEIMTSPAVVLAPEDNRASWRVPVPR